MLRRRLNFYRCKCGQNFRRVMRCSCHQKCPKCGERVRVDETRWL